jgi:hypothetical protein
VKRVAKRQQRIAGDVVEVDLGDGSHTYARVLEEAMFAFYDCRTTEDLAVDAIIAGGILFIIPVMDHAVKRGRWIVVGSAPLNAALMNPPPRFMQDALNLDSFSIYEKGKIRSATKEECIGLEREAVWDPGHVEDRIRDHYLGRKNKWVESLKIKCPVTKSSAGDESPKRR